MDISDKLVAAAMKNLEKLLISKGFTAESMISKFDTDRDGKINLDEFDNGLTRLTGSKAPRSYLGPIFSAIDINGSGFLEQSELLALLGIENKTSIDSPSISISGHVNEKYNGKKNNRLEDIVDEEDSEFKDEEEEEEIEEEIEEGTLKPEDIKLNEEILPINQ